jgi:phosphate/sulfate permease
MEIIIVWIIAAAIVGAIGSGTTWGFWGVFAASVFLSPLIGFILALALPSAATVANNKRLMAMQQQQLVDSLNGKKLSATDELQKLATLKEKGTITDDEYNAARAKWVSQL